MYYALGWHFVHQYALAGNLYYVTQPQSFSNRAFNHTLYVSTFFAGFFPWSIVALGGAVDTIRPLARAHQDSPGGNSPVGLGRPSCFVFFSIARFKVDRYLYPAAPACCLLAARAWMSVSVFRPDLAAARDNVFARWSVDRARGSSSSRRGPCRHFRCSTSGLDLPRAARADSDQPRRRRRWCSRRPSFGASRVADRVRGSARDAARNLRLRRWRSGSRCSSAHARHEAVADSLRPNLAADDQVALYRLEKWRFSLRYYLSGRWAGCKNRRTSGNFSPARAITS